MVQAARDTSAHAKDEAIECLVGDDRVGIPMALVDQIVEVDVSPLPLAKEHVWGLAIHAGHVLVVVGLGPYEAEAGSRRKVVLMRSDGGLGWAIAITRVATFVRLSPGSGAGRARWRRPATTADGRSLERVDVEAIRADLLLGGLE